MAKQVSKHSKDYVDIKPMDTKQMLVLSLGTGEGKEEKKYSAAKASKWGLINWIYDGGKSPILDIFSDASADMVDHHVSTFFQVLNNKDNYLRIQVNTLGSSIVTRFIS